ncbi:MAG: hypothetical protein FRX48_07009 [Lasallia pustulata]|uniref:Uncharacterized protein n=1 Tax=Lasallia pustulata TaxID=136370 RepID=A0A5M8PKK5_9LECA|nr:MAG: hypothetical protein FRX48_07009 [Lasallia pustulata]
MNGKDSGLAMTEAQQILLAYEHFNAEFQRDLPVCNESSKMSDFMKHITVQKSIWFDLFVPKSYDPRSNNRKFNRGGYNNNSYVRTPFQPLSSGQYQGIGPYERYGYDKDFRGEIETGNLDQSLFQYNNRDYSNNPQANQKPAIKQESGRYKAPAPGSPKNQDAQFCGRDGGPRNNGNRFQTSQN